MAHNEQNFQIHHGDAKDLIFTCVDSNGAPLDLSLPGLSLLWTVKRHPLSNENLIAKSSPGDIILPSPLTNQCIIRIEHADTLSDSPIVDIVPVGVYFHKLTLEDGSPNPSVLAHGTISIE